MRKCATQVLAFMHGPPDAVDGIEKRYIGANMKIFLAGLGLCTVFLLSSCSTIDEGMMEVTDAVTAKDAVTGERELNLESEEQEIRRTTESTRQILESYKSKGLKIDSELPEYSRIQRVFARLKQVVHRQNLPWEIHEIQDDNSFNAFTGGGGKIFIQSGLFKTELGGVQNDDELAAIIAHEMGHVAARHGSEQMAKKIAQQLIDEKAAARGTFKASFSTLQEDEADKYSTLYMALAGYNPEAGTKIWTRFDKKYGSSAGNLLYDHPLFADRAKSLLNYASKTKQYFTRGKINPNHVALLKSNSLYQVSQDDELKAGEGGGFVSLVETAANVYSENLQTKIEEYKRQGKQVQQQQQQRKEAIQTYRITSLKIQQAQGGGYGLFGLISNASNKKIKQGQGNIEYVMQGQIIYKEAIGLPLLEPFASQQFGIKLQPIQYDSVRLVPLVVQFEE